MSRENAMTDSIQIYLNSRYATIKPTNDTGYCVFQLPQITIPDGHYIYMSLQNAIIPYSFYSINPSNNVFIIESNSNTYTCTIEPGNYNIHQMITALSDQLGGLFTITYNSIKNKITITNSTYEFTVLKDGTLNHGLGFPSSQDTPSTSQSVTSEHCVNLNLIRSVNVDISMPTGNINSSNPNNQSIIACIPVAVQPFGMINYDNPNNFKINMYMNKIDMIKIKLLDNQNNLLDMNQVNWQMTFQVDIVEFT